MEGMDPVADFVVEVEAWTVRIRKNTLFLIWMRFRCHLRKRWRFEKSYYVGVEAVVLCNFPKIKHSVTTCVG